MVGYQPAFQTGAPVVSNFGLLTVADQLSEDAQLVADRVACCVDVFGCHGVHEASSQTTQTAVAQTCVGFGFKDIACLEAHFFQSLGELFAAAQIVRILHQRAANQEFHGHVVNLLALVILLADGLQTAHQLADNHSTSLEHLFVGCFCAGHCKISAQLILNGAAHLIYRDFTQFHKSFSSFQ